MSSGEKAKAVIDTNVFVSGVFWKGPPHRILQAWKRGEFTWVVSPPILKEYRRVLDELAEKYPPGTDRERLLEVFETHAEAVEPVAFARPVCGDPDDDKFLGAALAARAGFVVTGDRALLAVDGFRGLQVIPARDFLVRLGTAA